MSFSLARLIVSVMFLTPFPLPSWEGARKTSQEEGEGLPWSPDMSVRCSGHGLTNAVQKMPAPYAGLVKFCSEGEDGRENLFCCLAPSLPCAQPAENRITASAREPW